VAKRLAQEFGVDLGRVRGTGPGGQVRERDIRDAAAAGAVRTAPDTAPPYAVLPESTIRKTTAQRMAQSAAIPQFHLTVPIEMTALLAARAASKSAPAPTITAMLVKAAAGALTSHPRVNAQWVDGQVRNYRAVNIGVAVATEHGLVVPIVHDAHRLSLPEIDRQLAEKRARAARHALTVDDVGDGTFTISNLGAAGVLHFTALINPPQTAILAVGALHTAWAGEGTTPRPVPTCMATLTGDHRAMDGMDGLRFLQALKNAVEAPETSSAG
jgi:pyruvate dehydrogenase E2 component (dihydrolipoamide acetyltransferase)